MTALAQTAFENGPCVPPRFLGGSGHYAYKSWKVDANGERIARKHVGRCPRAQADLVANSYRNANGLETVFGIVFDFDAHRAKEHWKDNEGKLDWTLIFTALKREIPQVAELICYAVRSTGGLGLGVVMAITPLPILPSTAANQQAALKLQGRLLTVFDKMGLGADFGARGVSRDLPNFNDPERLVFRNTRSLRDLECSGRPVVSELHKVLNARERAARAAERLYNDERVEKGLAKLVLWLLGVSSFDRAWTFDGQPIKERQPKEIPYLSGWSRTVTLRELCRFTGLSEGFLRRFLKDPPEWLQTAHHEAEGWTLAIPLSRAVPWLEERSFYLMQKTQALSGRVSFDPGELCLPWWVQDGERNAWIVRLALLYKWAGYSLASTTEKVLLRVQAMEGFETSRNCRLVRSIVRSLFRRKPENQGDLRWEALPEWMKDDRIFCSISKRVNTRRGVTPTRVGVRGDDSGEMSASSLVSFLGSSAGPKHFSEERHTPPELQENTVGHNASVTLSVVRHRQRIGIFHEGRLLLCMTRKHYKASQALKYLQQHNPRWAQVKMNLVSPRKDKQRGFFAAVDEAEVVFSGHQICGRKETLQTAIARWKMNKQ